MEGFRVAVVGAVGVGLMGLGGLGLSLNFSHFEVVRVFISVVLE